ncbi:hypothetical protein J3R30DRAFT_3470189 [Lentinula aciculospora]|uniref:Uncharacterized protein n=1 Tax=Lentinula aciculospora TaxID=153920 RepID=A0A9W9DQJ8_9AGAR|nr:hypothetical protein J3R30DRAFT_3470189 [Lentinula aciculospora]
MTCKRHRRRHSYNDTESSVGQISRRQLRYSRAEHALSISFHAHIHSTPFGGPTTDPLQIQLRILCQASAFLTAQASDVRERLDALSNGILKNRSDVDPENYRQGLIDRWKVQRNLEKLDDEVKRVEGIIANININSPDSTFPNQNPESRTQKNLIRFLRTTSVRPQSRQLRPQFRSSTLAFIDHAPRRITLADISPFRARPSSLVEALIRGHVRVKSSTCNLSTRLSTSARPSRRITAALCDSLGSISEAGSVLVTQSEEGGKAEVGLEGESTMTSAITSDPCATPPPATDANGIATIFLYPRQYLNLDDIELQVGIPIYAQDLFARFDRVGLALGKNGALDLAFSSLSSLSICESPDQTPKRTKYSSLPPPSAFLTPPRRLIRSSGSLKGRIQSLKPSVSQGSLPSNSPSKLPSERERALLLSIPESTSILSLSSSQTSLAPSGLENGDFRKEQSSSVVSLPPGIDTVTKTAATNEGFDSTQSSKVTMLKRKLSSRLSLSVFRSPTKTSKKRED